MTDNDRSIPEHNPRAVEWWDSSPLGLRHLITKMTWHTDVKWAVPDYVDDVAWAVDGRRETDELDKTEALSSALVGVDPWINLSDGEPDPNTPTRHMLALDLDVPAWLVPSSTYGHGHLYVDLTLANHGGVPAEDLFEFLRAAAKIGLLEEGYVNACIERGMTSVRAPWVRKGREEDDAGASDHDVTPDDWKVPSPPQVDPLNATRFGLIGGNDLDHGPDGFPL